VLDSIIDCKQKKLTTLLSTLTEIRVRENITVYILSKIIYFR